MIKDVKREWTLIAFEQRLSWYPTAYLITLDSTASSYSNHAARALVTVSDKSGELSMFKDDEVVIKSQLNHDWCTGVCRSKFGLVRADSVFVKESLAVALPSSNNPIVPPMPSDIKSDKESSLIIDFFLKQNMKTRVAPGGGSDHSPMMRADDNGPVMAGMYMYEYD